MTYTVYIQVNDTWIPASREFQDECMAQEWALDLDTRWRREVRRVEE